MKKLHTGEQRFIVKQIDKLYRVYDRVWGSYPYQRKELGGTVLQDVSQAEAEAEADRLEQLVGQAPAKARVDKKQKQKKEELLEPETVEVEQSEDLVDELPDYGIMSEEERKKYEEGTPL